MLQERVIVKTDFRTLYLESLQNSTVFAIPEEEPFSVFSQIDAVLQLHDTSVPQNKETYG